MCPSVAGNEKMVNEAKRREKEIVAEGLAATTKNRTATACNVNTTDGLAVCVCGEGRRRQSSQAILGDGRDGDALGRSTTEEGRANERLVGKRKKSAKKCVGKSNQPNTSTVKEAGRAEAGQS